MSCKNQVTTKSGTFTFHLDMVTYCEAKKICASKGEIVAPITNREDLEAVTKLALQDCGGFRDWTNYTFGLDIKVCDDEEERVFTNGVKWDESLHGGLYVDAPNAHDSNIRTADFDPTWNANHAYIVGDSSCTGPLNRFICLKPAEVESTSEALVKNNHVESFNFLAILAFVVPTVAFFCAIGVAIKFHRRIQYLKAKK